MRKPLLVLALISTLSLSACAGNDGYGNGNPWGMGNKQTVGTGAGALIGGVLGSRVGKGSGQLWATGAGALLGAFAGSEVGKSLDRADMQYHQQAVSRAYAAPLNEPISWDNPESGHRGYVTPVQEGRSSGGGLCRKFKEAIFIDGQAQTAYGTACQQPDGSWKIRN
jgi:surface antigen